MPFSPNHGSQDTLITASGMSLFTTSGIYLISGSTRGQCSIVSTGNSFATFYPPNTPPGNLRSGNIQLFNNFGNATTTDYFTWIQTPFISGIAPLSGQTGISIKISGSGIRDLTGLYFSSVVGTYTGAMADPVFESSTWTRTVTVPWMSGGLNVFTNIKGMSEGGSSTASQLFYIREDGISLSGITNFPTPILAYQYLRANSTADGLEWQTPNQVLVAITGVNKSGGDYLTGEYFITGGKLNVTGLNIQNSGITTGNMIFDTISSGAFLVLSARIGGITWIGSTLQYS